MTGDGLRFAVRGAELAADAALAALEHGWTGVARPARRARGASSRRKWRFNRALRALVASPRGVEAGRVRRIGSRRRSCAPSSRAPATAMRLASLAVHHLRRR